MKCIELPATTGNGYKKVDSSQNISYVCFNVNKNTYLSNRYFVICLLGIISFVYFCLGVAPGIFRQGLTLPTTGLEYGFQGTITAKDLRKKWF